MPTNMDTNKNKNATSPILEFRLPVSEVDRPLKLGEHGMVSIPSEVVDISDGYITFRKEGKCECDQMGPESSSMMKEKMDKVEVDDAEMPFKKK